MSRTSNVIAIANTPSEKASTRRGLMAPDPPARLRLLSAGGGAAGRDNPRPVNADARGELIRDRCSFRGRLAGTDAERRAAGWLAATIRARGRRVDVEPTYVHPQAPLVEAAHCALGFA